MLQGFRWTRPLYNAFTARLMDCEESILGPLVQDVFEKLASNDWDYIAPFALLNQLWLYRPMKENLDLVKAQMLEKLVARC